MFFLAQGKRLFLIEPTDSDPFSGQPIDVIDQETLDLRGPAAGQLLVVVQEDEDLQRGPGMITGDCPDQTQGFVAVGVRVAPKGTKETDSTVTVRAPRRWFR